MSKKIVDWFQEGKELDKLQLEFADYREFQKVIRERGISPRTAYYLIEIYRLFTNTLKETPPPDVDWRRIVAVKDILTKYNMGQILTFCRANSRPKVEMAIKTGELKK